jgi:hypothetical protein
MPTETTFAPTIRKNGRTLYLLRVEDYSPACKHPGCSERASVYRGRGKNSKALCRQHAWHNDYYRLRALAFPGGGKRAVYALREEKQ